MQNTKTHKNETAAQGQNVRKVCPNCGQWQNPHALGGYDCVNDCVGRGLAPRPAAPAPEAPQQITREYLPGCTEFVEAPAPEASRDIYQKLVLQYMRDQDIGVLFSDKFQKWVWPSDIRKSSELAKSLAIEKMVPGAPQSGKAAPTASGNYAMYEADKEAKRKAQSVTSDKVAHTPHEADYAAVISQNSLSRAAEIGRGTSWHLSKLDESEHMVRDSLGKDIMVLVGASDANARLIAAAPETAAERDTLKGQVADLLVALQETTRCLAWHNERHGVAMDNKAVEDARAAIARAEGRAQ